MKVVVKAGVSKFRIGVVILAIEDVVGLGLVGVDTVKVRVGVVGDAVCACSACGAMIELEGGMFNARLNVSFSCR